MKMKFISLLFLQMLYFQNGLAQMCPPDEMISPCWCFHFTGDLMMFCRGVEITQSVIDNAVKVLRGDLHPADWLQWPGRIHIANTTLETLDLSAFFLSQINSLNIEYNPNLASITGPSEFIPGRIAARAFVVRESERLDDAGLGEAVKYFKPSLLTELTLVRCNLTGYYGQGENGLELIPGLSSINPILLNLYDNQIRRIKPGTFKNMTRLDTLNLNGNYIEEIEENTYEVHPNHTGRYYSVRLGSNLLRDERIHNNIGMGNLNVMGYLTLSNNQMETFSRGTFEHLLAKKPNGDITVYNNPIICDERVKWLKDRKDEFRLKFPGADCANDPGFTVFNSNLIP